MELEGGLGKISGLISTLGVVIIITGALTNIDWIIYAGIILLVGGGAAYRFMGI